MYKIALIVPRGSKYGKNPLLKDFLEKNNVVSNFYGAWETPNLSLLTIANLIPETYEVKFIDEDHGAAIPFDEQFDIVALTGMTQQIYRAYEIAQKFRENGVHVVIGGIHATIMPDEVSQYANTVIIGEGETCWVDFLSDWEQGKAKERYVNKESIALEQSPVPRYSVLDKSLYKSYSLQTTRGCPRTCSYCTLPTIFGSKFRQKNIDQIVNEVKAIQNVDKDSFIFFADDNMFIRKEFSKKLLQELIPLNITWGTQTDISVAYDEELLQLLYQAGCHWLFIGFENVTQKGLRFLDKKQWKAQQLEKYEQSIEKIHNNGINIWGSFMFGGDNDTLSVFSDTLDFVIRNGIYSGSFTIMTPLPGTQLFKEMKEANRIIDYDWSRYTFWDVVFQPACMSPDDLSQGVAWVYDQFYSRENVQKRASELRKRLKQVRRKYAANENISAN